jgi:hypothetical protein
MESEEYAKDCLSIQSTLRNPYAAKDWKTLKESIQKFMKATKRTWSGAIFILLERGISEYERNGTVD